MSRDALTLVVMETWQQRKDGTRYGIRRRRIKWGHIDAELSCVYRGRRHARVMAPPFVKVGAVEPHVETGRLWAWWEKA